MKEGDRIRDGRIEAIVLPTKERSAKLFDGEKEVLIVEGSRGGVGMQSFAHPLDFYLRKELITRDQWRAGDKLHELFVGGTVPGHTQFRYRESNGVGRNPSPDPPGAASKEFRAAIMSIHGLKARDVTHDVCCEGIPLRMSKQFRNKWAAKRYGMDYLKEGLDDLVRHFRY